MTSKLRQKATSILALVAIVVLLVIIVVVWVQVGNGAFGPTHKFNVTEKNDEWTSQQQNESARDTTRTTHLDDLGHISETQLVRPWKSNANLEEQTHSHDDEPPALRHRDGKDHFRHRASEAWDPKPEYEIDAFGVKLRLQLVYDGDFVATNLYITHYFDNYTERVRHDPKTTGCFYSGVVKGDKNSSVAVSLCNGMTGYIHTSQGTYYIKPVDNFDEYDSAAPILHQIRKVKDEYNGESGGSDFGSQCETQDDKVIVDDDFATEERRLQGDRKKREVLRFDDIDSTESASGNYSYTAEYRRSSREIVWSPEYDRTKRTDNREYFIEVLIVADKKMMEYHRTKDILIHYILTLMSHVALLFKDATVGNPVSLALIKISILNDKVFSSETSWGMLKKFCEWQNENNHGLQHDTAILLTRETICKNSTAADCNTLGVAEVGSMCLNSSCAVVRDKGLSTSFTIAHEIGHLLSMQHDDHHKCFKYTGYRKAKNIMSKVLMNDTKPWQWSACSRHFLNEFLNSPKAHCLLDRPEKRLMTDKFSDVLPGEFFEVDRQCELEFGIGSRICSLMVTDTLKCASLWCTIVESGGCRTQHMPWADGTSCGFNRWCHHGKCIALDRESLAPIDGIWGAWQPWGDCSRTCGGGIKISQRSCNSPPPSNGGSYCIGGSVRYESCNNMDCDPDSLDFRAIQCSEFDGNPFEHKNLTDVKWIPKYDDLPESANVCSLFCQVEGAKNLRSTLREKVIDGTKCSFNSFDICVNGMCRQGGCDNRIDSKLMLDDCGVCNGDNSSCIEINGTYNLQSNYGYHKVVRIPKGSSNIHIQQYGFLNSKHDDNYLVLVDGVSGHFILNGNFVITTSSVEIIYGGLTVMYSGSAKSVEEIRTPKNIKLHRDLILQVLTVGEILPPNITYHYTINKTNAPKYGWHLVNRKWSECNSICSGTRHMLPTCVDLATNGIMPDTKCPEWTMHSRTLKQECNTHCQLVWNVSSTGPCLAHCGKGVRNLYYKCMQVDAKIQHLEIINSQVGYGYGLKVDDNHCAHLQKPPMYEQCDGPCDSTSWQYDEWTQCTKSCGAGRQFRTAKCVDDKNVVIDDSHCDVATRFTEQICNVDKCPIWSYGDWTPCSATCGKGIRTQPYYCTINGQVTNPTSCNLSELQILKEECETEVCKLSVRWFSGNWGPCSATCGNGFRKRDVFCQSYDERIVSDSHCRDLLKPDLKKSCVSEQCDVISKYRWGEKWPDNEITDNSIYPYDVYKWVTGAWTQCSRTCSSGEKSRMVVCRNGSGKENPVMCDGKVRPVEHVKCNTEPCPKWAFGDWGECTPLCERGRQVICQNSTGSIVHGEQCDETERPINTTKCTCPHKIGSTQRKKAYGFETRKNLKYKWKTTAWGPCPKSCGRSVKTRTVTCRDTANDVTVDDGHCRQFNKPRLEKYCKQFNRSHCSFVWVEGLWSQCSKTCGEGTKWRRVTCHRVTPTGVDPSPVIHHNKCDPFGKPPTLERCGTQRDCGSNSAPFHWNTTSWSQCTEICGRKGFQKRRIFCVNAKENRVKRKLCPRQSRPAKKKKCNRFPCKDRNCKEVKNRVKTTINGDYNLLVNGKVVKIYCYKMDTREPEEFISLAPGKENFAQLFHKRLHNSQSCPRYENPEDCDCSVIDERAGYTNFWKTRLNITSMQIIADDFTFSTTNGTKQRYGTAGDCYSEIEGCVRGRFSIDLSGTAFRLSDSVRWLNHGRKATVKMDDANDRQVKKGTCGGNCGNCMPDPNFGLTVEIT